MNVKQFGSAALFAVATVAAAIGAAPIAAADECDPTATVCQGPNIQPGNPSMAFAPTYYPDEYPYDSEWYYNSEDNSHPSTDNGHTGGGGGGHSR
jgi:hypothetical protein